MKINDWGFAEWLAQIVWLVIFASTFIGGVYWVINFYETTTIDPGSVLGVLATFIIFVPVAAVFLFQWLYGKILTTFFGFKEK